MSNAFQQSKQDLEFERCGIDIWMLRDNLKLSFEERIIQHQNTLDLIDELKESRRNYHEKSSQIPHRKSD